MIPNIQTIKSQQVTTSSTFLNTIAQKNNQKNILKNNQKSNYNDPTYPSTYPLTHHNINYNTNFNNVPSSNYSPLSNYTTSNYNYDYKSSNYDPVLNKIQSKTFITSTNNNNLNHNYNQYTGTKYTTNKDYFTPKYFNNDNTQYKQYKQYKQQKDYFHQYSHQPYTSQIDKHIFHPTQKQNQNYFFKYSKASDKDNNPNFQFKSSIINPVNSQFKNLDGNKYTTTNIYNRSTLPTTTNYNNNSNYNYNYDINKNFHKYQPSSFILNQNYSNLNTPQLYRNTLNSNINNHQHYKVTSNTLYSKPQQYNINQNRQNEGINNILNFNEQHKFVQSKNQQNMIKLSPKQTQQNHIYIKNNENVKGNEQQQKFKTLTTKNESKPYQNKKTINKYNIYSFLDEPFDRCYAKGCSNCAFPSSQLYAEDDYYNKQWK